MHVVRSMGSDPKSWTKIVQLFDKAGKSFAVMDSGAIYEFYLEARKGQLYIVLEHSPYLKKQSVSKQRLDDLYEEKI